jgi:hypothetical protein
LRLERVGVALFDRRSVREHVPKQEAEELVGDAVDATAVRVGDWRLTFDDPDAREVPNGLNSV